MRSHRSALGAITLVVTGLLQCASGLAASVATVATPVPLQRGPILRPGGPAPTSITAALTPASATLYWPAVAGASGYFVGRASTPAGPYASLTPVAIGQTTFTDPGLVPGTTYSWIVTAISGAFAGTSSPVTYTTPQPTNPTRFTATAGIGGFVTLSWQPVAGATAYSFFGGTGGQGPARTVPAASTQFVDYTMNLPAGVYPYELFAIFRGNAGTFIDSQHPAQTSVVLRGAAPHTPWLTIKDPYASAPDPTGATHAAEASQYLNSIGALPAKATLGQWMQANGFTYASLAGPAHPSATAITARPAVSGSATLASTTPIRPSLDTLRAVYFNAGDLNLGRDMRCQQTGQNIACMVSNFAPATNAFVADAPDAQTALAGAIQGAHTVSSGYLATVAMEVSLAKPDDVRFYVFGPSDTFSTVAVLDTESNPQSHLPGGYSPFNCIACHGGTYDTSTHTVKGASFLPFDVYSFQYSQQPGFTQADQEEVLRRLNALVKSTRPSGAGSNDAIATFIDGMYAGNVGVPGARANNTWVPAGWMTPFPAGPNVYNAIVKPFCRTCHLAIGGDLSFPSYQKFRNPAASPYTGQPLGGYGDIISAVLCGGRMPQAEVPFRKFWQNPNISWIGYLQDPSVMGLKCQ